MRSVAKFWFRRFSLINGNIIQRLMARDDKLLCAFGVIADVQYADIDNGMNYSQTAHRGNRGV